MKMNKIDKGTLNFLWLLVLIIGALVSLLIIQHIENKENRFIKKICNNAEESNCTELQYVMPYCPKRTQLVFLFKNCSITNISRSKIWVLPE